MSELCLFGSRARAEGHEESDLDVLVEPKTHAGAIHLLNVEFIRPGLLPSSFNRLFAGLQRSRELADYDAAVTFSREDAQAEIDAARSFESAALDLLRVGGG